MFCHFSIHIALFFEPADTPEVAIHPSLSDFSMFLIHIHRWERKIRTLDISCFTADNRQSGYQWLFAAEGPCEVQSSSCGI